MTDTVCCGECAPAPGTEDILSSECLHAIGHRPGREEEPVAFEAPAFDALAASGYLAQAVPEDLGGLGLTLAEVCRQQRRLARHAPAAALAVNLHLAWTGAAAELWHRGDRSLEWLLRDACHGEVFAFAQQEPGSPPCCPDADCDAQAVDGGYCFSSHGDLAVLSPFWTRLGLLGLEQTAAGGRRLLQAFIHRDADGLELREVTPGADASAAPGPGAVLDDAFVPARHVVPMASEDGGYTLSVAFTLGVWEALAHGAVLAGLARAAFDRALATGPSVTASGERRVVAPTTERQAALAGAAVELAALDAHIECTAREWTDTPDPCRRQWTARALMARWHALATARRVVASVYGPGLGSAIVGGDWLQGILHAAGATASKCVTTREILAGLQ